MPKVVQTSKPAYK